MTNITFLLLENLYFNICFIVFPCTVQNTTEDINNFNANVINMVVSFV